MSRIDYEVVVYVSVVRQCEEHIRAYYFLQLHQLLAMRYAFRLTLIGTSYTII